METKKGMELAIKLLPSTGLLTHTVVETCSVICRHATTHGRIQVLWCNESMGEKLTAYWEKRESLAERRIRQLVKNLPKIGEQSIKVKFGGDPRGYTVKLIMPDGRYDTWGGAEDGLGVPQ